MRLLVELVWIMSYIPVGLSRSDSLLRVKIITEGTEANISPAHNAVLRDPLVVKTSEVWIVGNKDHVVS